MGVRIAVNRFEKWLLTVFFIELFIGGGGRLIDFGVLSIRQVLFLLILCTFVFRILKNKQFLDRNVNTFFDFNITSVAIYMLVTWFGVSALIGLIHGHALSTVAMDFFRVSFFLLYFPLAYYISEERYRKSKIISILKYSSLIVAVFTILISLAGKTIFNNNFDVFYNFINSIMNDDLFFRPSHSVFYKGHFFVLMGLLVSLNAVLSKQGSKVDVVNIIVCLISIIWSETRGFLLAIMFGILFIVMMDVKTFTDQIKGLWKKAVHLLNSKFILKKIVVSLLIVIAVPFMYKYMTIERFGTETVSQQKPKAPAEKPEEPQVNDVSVNSRLEFISASKDLVFKNVPAFVVGSGYGTEIAGRDSGIEMSFLDILVEQGVIGLALWLYVCFIIFYNYHLVYKAQGSVETTDISLLACIAALVLLTNINPFINNPLGIGFILTVLVLSKNKRDALKRAV
ncbi:O-antigen ligase family protein [Ectobacillus funiculus]|uniref:O-antigen ligase family protein n=1 Tax=Ectobacillus funiculus TaxID=137993 RepID=A0ABV5WAG5_9BACI